MLVSLRRASKAEIAAADRGGDATRLRHTPKPSKTMAQGPAREKTTVKRRTFIASAAAAAALPLAHPAIGATAKTLIFVPQANLTSLDPVWTTATVTRNFSLMVYETLYGRDQSFNPQPQMVEGHAIDADGRRWTMKLREGLVFHDGTPVLARDCVASLQRWLKRDAVSETFNARVDAIEAPDDRTLIWRLKKPFPLLAPFLSKLQPQPVMVPARLAATNPFKQLTDIVAATVPFPARRIRLRQPRRLRAVHYLEFKVRSPTTAAARWPPGLMDTSSERRRLPTRPPGGTSGYPPAWMTWSWDCPSHGSDPDAEARRPVSHHRTARHL